MEKEITPKEKAKELVDRIFAEIASAYSGYYETAKGIAVIMVEEILGLLFQHHEIDYWKEVKQEIEKLEYGN